MKDGVLLSLEDVSVQLGAARHVAVNGVSFELHEGERVALIGPSGCGKTTSLRAIAGFERLQGGKITLSGRLLSDPRTHVPPHHRKIGMVFQDYALFPHMNLAENIGFGLAHLSASERDERVLAVVELTGLDGLTARRPGQLSGGQQQRVALARALAPHPHLILLDEPFASLDANLRAATRAHTERVLSAVGATALLVTHDQEEAMSFASRLIVLRDGRIEQQGSPEQVYRAPVNAFVAQFLGAANLLPAEANGEIAESALGTVTLQRAARGAVLLCLRPENMELRKASGGFRVEITAREYLGSKSMYRVSGGGFELTVAGRGDATWTVGEFVSLEVVAEAAVLAAN